MKNKTKFHKFSIYNNKHITRKRKKKHAATYIQYIKNLFKNKVIEKLAYLIDFIKIKKKRKT